MTGGEHILQEDLALYAMQALSMEESAVVRTHLVACALCRGELAELSGDLALVGLSVEPHPAPEGARQRFIDRISAAPSPMKQPAQALAGPMAKGRRVRGPGFWVPWAAVAALVITVISLSVKISALNEELRSESGLTARLAAKASRAQQVLEVLTAPSAQRVTLTPGKALAEPTGRATYLADRGSLIFQASNLEPLREDKTYELWVIPANGQPPIPAGLFRPDAMGSASLVLPPLPSGISAKAFGVTIEKAAGSNSPTTPIILSGVAAPASGE